MVEVVVSKRLMMKLEVIEDAAGCVDDQELFGICLSVNEMGEKTFLTPSDERSVVIEEIENNDSDEVFL